MKDGSKNLARMPNKELTTAACIIWNEVSVNNKYQEIHSRSMAIEKGAQYNMLLVNSSK